MDFSYYGYGACLFLANERFAKNYSSEGNTDKIKFESRENEKVHVIK